MTAQEKDDCLKEVTAWSGLTVFILHALSLPPPYFLEVIFTFPHLHQLEVEHLMPGLDLDLNSGQTGSFAFSQTTN